MKQFNPKNERIKKAYFDYLKEADRKAETTINGIRKAILRYEVYTGFREFSSFNKDQAVAFKHYMAKAKTERTGEPLSKSTLLATMNALKDFFKWLSCQPGYKSRIHAPDIQYLNLSEKDASIARMTRQRDTPTIEQVRHVVQSMPTVTDIQRRNRALVAFTALTGMRDSAVTSLRLQHVDTAQGLVKQEPDKVKTKFSKKIDTFFFPVGDDLKGIVLDWIRELREVKLFGFNDPIFPRTQLGHDENDSFTIIGLARECWTTTTQVRKVFKEAFAAAGLPYFHPHSFRHMLVRMGQQFCRTPEEFKAWSQNLGHEQVLTTYTSYGHVPVYRQGEVIKGLATPRMAMDAGEIERAVKFLSTLTPVTSA
jgi:integrase